MPADPEATTLPLEGASTGLFVISVLFSVLTTIVVGLRCWVKTRLRSFGVDDGLMLAGWVLFICAAAFTARGSFVGICSKDVRLNQSLRQSGNMYIFLFQVFYCSSNLLIKSSICCTLLRFAIERVYRIIIWIVLVISVLSPFITTVGIITKCKPVEAAWNNPDRCSPPIVILSLSYLISATSVATDWVCAILPACMLHKVRMKRATKVSISIVLGLGVMASISTIIRFPYIAYYGRSKDYLYYVGIVGLWSAFESGTGIIAGSLPSLRRLLKNWVSFDPTPAPVSLPHPITPLTEVSSVTATTSDNSAAPNRRRCDTVEEPDGRGSRHQSEVDGIIEHPRPTYVAVDRETRC